MQFTYTRRVAKQYGICWLKKELPKSHDTWYTSYFLLEIKLTFILHFSMGNKSCPNELKFCEVSGNLKSKNSDFYLDK